MSSAINRMGRNSACHLLRFLQTVVVVVEYGQYLLSSERERGGGGIYSVSIKKNEISQLHRIIDGESDSIK